MTNRQRAIIIGSLAGTALLLLLAVGTMFTVDERQLAVVLQFGEPVAGYTEPGLRFKIPLFQKVQYLPKTHQFSGGAGGEVLEDLPTADGKKIEVTAWAVWRITDPIRFVQILRTVEEAELRVNQFVRGEMRDVITANTLGEVVRSTDRQLKYPVLTDLLKVLQEGETEAAAPPEKPTPPDKPAPKDEGPVPPPQDPASLQDWVRSQTDVKERIRIGRERIVQEVKRVVQQRLSEAKESEQGRGIELVDVGISRIDFVPSVREAAFARQIARWESIASFYENQGQKQKQQILNRTGARIQEVLGEGTRESNRVKGEIEAKIIDAYAEAIRETGGFYNFLRTLEAYRQALGKHTRLVLTTDSALLQLLKRLPELPEPPPSAPRTEKPKP